MKTIIIGGGEVGFHIAKGLSEENFDTTVIDISREKVRRASENLDVIAIRGDGASPQTLKEAGVHNADITVAVTRVDEVNLIASQLAHELGTRKIIARLRNTEYSRKGTIIHPEKFGIDKVIHPEMAATREIVQLVMQTAASSVVEFEGGRLQLIGIRLHNGCPLIDINLGTIRENNSHYSFAAVAVFREKKTIIPRGDLKFKYNDICYFFIKKDDIPNLLKMVGKPRRATRDVMILGASKIGRAVAQKLQDHIHVRLIEGDKEKAQLIATELDKTLTLNGDGTDIEFLRSENVDEMDSFIAVTQNEQTNLLSALLAKHLGARQSIVHISTTEYIPVMKLIGLDGVISKNMCTVNAILEYIRSDQNVLVTNFEDIEVEALELTPIPGSRVTRFVLGEIKFPASCVVGSVNHHGHISIPSGDTQITEEDSVLVFALPEVIPKVEKLFL